MSSFIVSYSNIAKKTLRRLVHVWGSAEETVRVVAFLCIVRITTNQQSSHLDFVLRSMYVTYVRNCKFVSTATLAEINFMRRSLVEMFSLDADTAYRHAFLYIRQLAIQLRTAVTMHRKDDMKTVCSWQYVSSLQFWTAFLSASGHKNQLRPLIYPLVQVVVGAVKLVPTVRYFPLRFHCVRALIELSREANVFIPILPLLLEVRT